MRRVIGVLTAVFAVCGLFVVVPAAASARGGTGAARPATAAPRPNVDSVYPSQGPTAGGNTVAIYGDDLTGTSRVYFGATSATIVSTSDSEVDVTAPARARSTVDITVVTPGGRSSITGGDVYTYSDTPVVTGLSQSSGSYTGGDAVQIFGSNFTGATAVKFGTVAASSLLVASDTEIDVTSPASSAGGTVDVTVTGPHGTSTIVAGDEYTFTTKPVVDDLSVNTGPTAGGTAVQIFGTNLGGTTAVAFGGQAATVSSVSSTEVDVISPAGSSGAVDITVTTPKGTSTLSAGDVFTYTDVPSITSLSVSSGPTGGGTPVQIFGLNLSGATKVYFGTTAATIASIRATSITVIAPAHVAGAVDVTVTTAKGTSPINESDSFTYSDLPVVGELEPSAGPTAGGTTVQIFGSNLDGTTAVHFGTGSATSVTNVSASEVDAVTPAGTAGAVNVTVTTAGGTSAVNGGDIFTYTDRPVVYGLSPSQGQDWGGTVVDIYGANFTNGATVKFGSTASTSVSVLDSTDLRVVTPAHASGVVRVSVTTGGGSSVGLGYGNDQFTYGPLPVVEDVYPQTGPTRGGTSVEIDGSNFDGATEVDFGGVAATIVSQDSTSIQVTSPAESAGTVDVTVTTPSGTSAVADADLFTYDDTPAINDIDPSSGPAAGGTDVTIDGNNLAGVTSVLFGSVAGQIVDQSADSIEVTSPAQTASTVDITVVAPTGTSMITESDEFTYSSLPVVDQLDPNTGSYAGASVVDIYGENLAGATSVKFGATTATILSTSDDGQSIEVKTPAHGAGAVHVQVTTPAGTSVPSGSDIYTYTSAPVIDSLSPDTGPTAGGTAVEIDGTNFSATTGVSFGGRAAQSFHVVSRFEIDAVSPTGTAGTVNVQVTTSRGTSSIAGGDEFTYTDAPDIQFISPNQGPTAGGGTVEILGDNLGNTTKVLFGTVSATFTLQGDGEVDAIAPRSAARTVNVRVTTPAGTTDISGSDKYVYSDVPSVQYLSQSSGSTAGGDAIQIYGSSLAGATKVTFGTTAATGVTPVSAGEVDAVVPAHAAGSVHVTVTTPKGTSVISGNDIYTYGSSDAALVSSTRRTGTTHGGGLVRLYGTQLPDAPSVLFGRATATRVYRASAHELDVVAPPHAAGIVSITVRRSSGAGIGGRVAYRYR